MVRDLERLSYDSTHEPGSPIVGTAPWTTPLYCCLNCAALSMASIGLPA